MSDATPHVYDRATADANRGWRTCLPEGVRPYLEPAPLAALFLGISSGSTFAMIGATLTTRLAQYGITKSAVTMFALTFLAYNFKFLWAPLVDTVRIPLLGRVGQRRSWLWVSGVLVIAAVVLLGSLDPQQALTAVAVAAVLVGIAGATFDIVIDAYRIELLEPRQLGVGSGMSQYGWRIGAASAGAVALVLAARYGWAVAYGAAALFALPAMAVGLAMGEPARHREPAVARGAIQAEGSGGAVNMQTSSEGEATGRLYYSPALGVVVKRTSHAQIKTNMSAVGMSMQMSNRAEQEMALIRAPARR